MNRKQRRVLYNNYLDLRFRFNNSSRNLTDFFNCTFILSLPKRQQHFNFYDLKLEKKFGFSCGLFLLRMGRKLKSFKRNHKNIMSINLHFKKIYSSFFKYIYFFLINNFNYRQYAFFKKFMYMLSPSVYYFLHRQSYMPKFLNKRRIKRRVLRKLKSIS